MTIPALLRTTFFAAFAFVTSALQAADLKVSAAASLTDALKEIATTYEKQSGDQLIFNFAASSALARQIQEGAPVDVFLSADEAKMDQLEKASLLAAGTRRPLLSNTLAIVVEKAGSVKISTAADLAGPAVKRLALGETSSVPAGVYAKAYLEKLGLWAQVQPKVVPTENVRAALAAVESGNVEAGIVYQTDAVISSKVRIAYAVPVGEGPAISYPVAVIKASSQPDAARRFVDYLGTDAAKAVFQKFGFIIPR